MTEPDRLPPADEPVEAIVIDEPDADDTPALPGRGSARVAMASLLLGFIGIVGVLLPQARPVVVPLCLSLVPLLAVALLAAIPFALAGKGGVPRGPLAAGWLVIVGGAACDIYATVGHSPDLAREANPVIRGLLDNGIPLRKVYLFGAVFQSLFIGLAMVLWLGLLTHRHTLVATMPRRGLLLAYFKAGTGGRELTYRQWLCPLTVSELPSAYHYACWCAVAFVGISAYRFYLALEWYGVVPVDPLWVRLVAPSVLLVATCWWYAAWLRAEATVGRAAEPAGQSELD